MSDSGLSRGLVQGTLEDLRGVIERLESQRAEIDRQLSDTKARTSHWERVLSKIDSNGSGRSRARRGENAKKILDLFEANPDRGYTLSELRETTGLAWSSVRNVVTQSHAERFEEREGQYYLLQTLVGRIHRIKTAQEA